MLLLSLLARLGSARLIAIDGRIKAPHNATRRIENPIGNLPRPMHPDIGDNRALARARPRLSRLHLGAHS